MGRPILPPLLLGSALLCSPLVSCAALHECVCALLYGGKTSEHGQEGRRGGREGGRRERGGIHRRATVVARLLLREHEHEVSRRQWREAGTEDRSFQTAGKERRARRGRGGCWAEEGVAECAREREGKKEQRVLVSVPPVSFRPSVQEQESREQCGLGGQILVFCTLFVF